jgi:hypothetical protein
MGICSETVSFAHHAPTAAEFVTALSGHTGEAVLFDEQTCVLSCRATGEAFWVYDEAFWVRLHQPDRSWLLQNVNLDGGYLWEASFAVLQLLGGEWTHPQALPVWAYKPWQLAKKAYDKHYQENFFWLDFFGLRRVARALYKRKRVPWLTYEQACAQGLGWK